MVDKLEENIAQLARSEREYAWREMARQIAHEIKNPLTPMKLNIQFLLRALEAEDSEKFAQRFREVSRLLMEQIDNMARTASAFSDFAKMSVMQREVFEVGDLLRDCVELFRNSVDTLECDIVSDAKMVGDREQMRRVIINLLKNAEQSIPQNRERLIKVQLQDIENHIVIKVRDNGCGISPEIGKRIFEPNFTTKSGGSGLGLAICQKIVEELGGQIEFTSELEIGTEFIVVLPKYQG
jgi:nitrogen fixation/metabolism regulation signal transduction histidine kinase